MLVPTYAAERERERAKKNDERPDTGERKRPLHHVCTHSRTYARTHAMREPAERDVLFEGQSRKRAACYFEQCLRPGDKTGGGMGWGHRGQRGAGRAAELGKNFFNRDSGLPRTKGILEKKMILRVYATYKIMVYAIRLWTRRKLVQRNLAKTALGPLLAVRRGFQEEKGTSERAPLFSNRRFAVSLLRLHSLTLTSRKRRLFSRRLLFLGFPLSPCLRCSLNGNRILVRRRVLCSG